MTATHERPEATDVEHKSEFANSARDRLELAKVIISMANSNGGTILISVLKCKMSELDSARLDDLVNSCAGPRLNGLVSAQDHDGCRIFIERSECRPHVMSHTKNYTDAHGNQRPAFHSGQIFVRHSSKTEPATADDLAAMLQERVATLFSKVGNAFQNLAAQVLSSGTQLSVSLSADGLPLSINLPDINNTHPWTTAEIGKKIGRDQNFVAQSMAKLGFKGDRRYCYILCGKKGQSVATRYSDAGVDALMKYLEAHPDYNPYRS